MSKCTTFFESPLGWMELKCEAEKLTYAWFTETPGEVIQNIFLSKCIEQFQAYFEGQLKTFDLPVHLEGSAFQLRVWQQLQTIPFNKTISYLDLARQLGDPLSIRAAAAANGKNPLAIVVPCHRVVGAKGQLTGYAGGLVRKQWLLAHEARVCGTFAELF